MSLGNVWLLTPDLDTWVIGEVHGSGGWNYPQLDDAWGALYSNTVWHVGGGHDAYLLLDASLFWGYGAYDAAEAGYVWPLWNGASVRTEGGVGDYQTPMSGQSFWMPSVGAGFDQVFPEGTTFSLRYAFQAQYYSEPRYAPRHQAYARLGQRLGGNWEAHLTYLETIDMSSEPYNEGYASVGLDYEL